MEAVVNVTGTGVPDNAKGLSNDSVSVKMLLPAPMAVKFTVAMRKSPVGVFAKLLKMISDTVPAALLIVPGSGENSKSAVLIAKFHEIFYFWGRLRKRNLKYAKRALTPAA